jgi:signal peptidase I
MSWGNRTIMTVALAVATTAACAPVPIAWLVPGDRGFIIPTGAMEPNLLIGDRIWAEDVDPSDIEIQRGEMVIFTYPIDESQIFIKRVIGGPGDRLKIQDKALVLNGKAVDEPYVEYKTQYIDNYRDNFPSTANVRLYEPALDMLENHVEQGEVVVPDGHYFVMGDNRDHSLDSRYWGFLPKEMIIARPMRIYFSIEVSAETETETVRWDRIGRIVEAYPLGERL